MTQQASRDPASPIWAGFSVRFGATAATVLLALLAAVAALDPYGSRTRPGRPPTPIMDLNQRYMYPQLARSGLFDSAVFGTSTVRLLDPDALRGALGGRFANLGLNAGTAWEQLQLAQLFLRHVPAPKTLIFGLDRAWCDPAADTEARRLTFRSFPPWLYDETALNDLPGLVSLRSLEIAGRVALHRLGLMPARIRQDGYEVFTPPEGAYDLARARLHLRPVPPRPGSAEPASVADLARRPALGWLADLLAGLPPSTRLALVFPPIHVAAQAVPGTEEEAADLACKRQAAGLAAGRGIAVDFRRPSPITTEDANYWDKLHYRQPIAGRIVEALRETFYTGRHPGDGAYVVLAR